MGNQVDAIKNKKEIDNLSMYFKVLNLEFFCLWKFGIYTGLRVSDILNLNVIDVKDKDLITIKEQKTNKIKQFPLKKN